MVVTMTNNGMPHSAPPRSARPGNYTENGREYHGFHKGKYMYPCDEDEMDRMDIYHKFFSVARRGALHSAPFATNNDAQRPGPRILDLGTGTGIWAIDMADKYYHLNAKVHGVDLSFIQPQSIPPNLTFSQRDFDEPLHDLIADSWDLIHMRMLNGSVTNWADFYAKVFKLLKPSFGWMEHIEIDMIPRCDDDTLPPTAAIHRWTSAILEASARCYRPLAYNTETRKMLEKQGFTEIQEQVIKVPLNPWEKDSHLKDIGRWYNLGLTQGLEALSLAPLTRMNNWKAADVESLVGEVKREVCSKRLHVYCNMHIWIARRPGGG